jgi:hypothetical protein
MGNAKRNEKYHHRRSQLNFAADALGTSRVIAVDAATSAGVS